MNVDNQNSRVEGIVDQRRSAITWGEHGEVRAECGRVGDNIGDGERCGVVYENGRGWVIAIFGSIGIR